MNGYQIFVSRYNYIPTIGIEETKEEINVLVYPNPSSNGKLIVLLPNYKDVLKIEILDNTGKQLRNIDNNISEYNSIQIDAAPGIYNIRFQLKNGNNFNKRIILQ